MPPRAKKIPAALECPKSIRDRTTSEFIKVLLPVGSGIAAATVAAATLEELLHKWCIEDVIGQRNANKIIEARYQEVCAGMQKVLTSTRGPFKDPIAAQFLAGALSAEDIMQSAIDPQPVQPRQASRDMFMNTIINGDTGCGREQIVDIATQLENSCYNETIRVCKTSEDPPCRNWDYPDFINIYSGRCGTINTYLNTKSTINDHYGSDLLARILGGDLSPAAIGKMSATELCPAATAIERATIASRQQQVIEVKESNFYRCPHCGARRCTWTSKQMRAADEPATIFCFCLECNHKFQGHSA